MKPPVRVIAERLRARWERRRCGCWRDRHCVKTLADAARYEEPI